MMRGMERRRAGVVKAATAIILAVAMGAAPQSALAQDAGADATAPPMLDGYSNGAQWLPLVP